MSPQTPALQQHPVAAPLGELQIAEVAEDLELLANLVAHVGVLWTITRIFPRDKGTILRYN